MADKLSKEIYMWENMIDELDVRALLTWAELDYVNEYLHEEGSMKY